MSCEDGNEDDEVGDQRPDADGCHHGDLLDLEHVLDEGGEGGPHRVPGLGVHHLRAVVETNQVPETRDSNRISKLPLRYKHFALFLKLSFFPCCEDNQQNNAKCSYLNTADFTS